MHDMDMNEELKALFTKDNGLLCELKKIVDNTNNSEILNHCLFLPYIFDEYLNSKPKIMYCGLQTNGWSNTLEDLKTSDLKDILESEVKCYQGFGNGKYYYNSPFWNFIEKIVLNPNQSDIRSLYWTDFFKLENNNKSPSHKLVKDNFCTVKDEIDIVTPDVAIFTTLSRSYFPYFCKAFGNKLIFDKRMNKANTKMLMQIATYNYDDNKKECKIIVVYHPNHIYRKGKQYKDEVLDAIIKEVENIK